jgi:diguanylate cyclase (GGDEF)-like protein
MTVLEATLRVVQRAGRAAGAVVLVLAIGALVATRFFERAAGDPVPTSRVLVLVLWALVFGWRVIDRRRAAEPRERWHWLRDLEIGLLLVVATHAVVQLAGGVEGAFYPLIYVLIALLVSFMEWKAVVALVAACLGLEAVVLLESGGPGTWWTLSIHGAFLGSFALLHVVFTRSEITRLRRSREQKLAEELVRAEQQAREFRLMAAPSTDGAASLEPGELERRRTLSAVNELRQSVFFALDLLKKSLKLHTAALLWLDPSNRLKIAELVSDHDGIAEGPFDVSTGVLGAAVASGNTVNLRNLRGQLADVPYYRAQVRIGALLAVPVVERGVIRGVLCIDRLEDEPFGEVDEAAMRAAARSVLQAAENERVFVALERTKDEQSKLYRASEALGTSLTEDEAIDAVLHAAQGIAPYDFAAVSIYDARSKRHKVVRAVGEGAEAIEGLAFSDNTGLASMAVKNRHYLPYRGEFDPRRQVVYTKRARLKGLESLLVLPLVAHDEPMGTLTLAARSPGVFTDTIRRTLQVLTNQMAVAVTNAKMVRALREMATTDGLTGLLNHRVFQEELEKKLKSAERFGHPLSVIITDLDKFKSVNDTYGHPVGDLVLRSFSRVLGGAMRETDLVARYGGEEFAVICEQTDAEGALNLADRIREEMARQAFQTDAGEFHVTCSLGIATFPVHTKDKEKLVECADQALYVAKQRGRNRAEVHRGIVEGHASPLRPSSRSSRPPPSPRPSSASVSTADRTSRSSKPPRPSSSSRPPLPGRR